ncbi:metal-dependent hydrolase [Actinomarinicola tropica]|nr:metal-dependent hydrolase [Actinomarinicola tropica]
MAFEASLQEVPRHFGVDGDLLSSHIAACLSSVFPDGEDFFVRSVRRFRDQVTDPDLKQQVNGFIGQEAVHGREARSTCSSWRPPSHRVPVPPRVRGRAHGERPRHRRPRVRRVRRGPGGAPARSGGGRRSRHRAAAPRCHGHGSRRCAGPRPAPAGGVAAPWCWAARRDRGFLLVGARARCARPFGPAVPVAADVLAIRPSRTGRSAS